MVTYRIDIATGLLRVHLLEVVYSDDTKAIGAVSGCFCLAVRIGDDGWATTREAREVFHISEDVITKMPLTSSNGGSGRCAAVISERNFWSCLAAFKGRDNCIA